MSEPQCYGVRRLNPFQGVLQVVQTDRARALSNDGVRWEIQVLAARPEHSWRSGNLHAPVLRYFRFGSWSSDSGLRQVPLSPIMEIDAMQSASATMVEALPGCLKRLPFPLKDRCELWLLDSNQLPLALLASSTDAAHLEAFKPEPWSATPLREHGFHSATLIRLGVDRREGQNPRTHAERLERLVRDAAGHPPRQGWFERRSDGTGSLVNGGRELGSTAFPRLLLRKEWKSAADSGLVSDYLEWCAPWLLTLPDLDDATRSGLERAAQARALEVDARYRLYPRIVHHQLIDAARVEARLRRSAGSP